VKSVRIGCSAKDSYPRPATTSEFHQESGNSHLMAPIEGTLGCDRYGPLPYQAASLKFATEPNSRLLSGSAVVVHTRSVHFANCPRQIATVAK
jgi:hypothetical protein